VKPPETCYAKSDDVHIAYQVCGAGPIDLVLVPGFVSHLEGNWEIPGRAQFFARLASFARLILFDKRGTGMSDRVSQIFTLEQRMDDVRAVMDAVGSERAALFGISEGGPMSILFATTYPTRTTALVIYGSYARRSWAPDHPWGLTDEGWEQMFDAIEHDWGGPKILQIYAPGVLENQEQQRAAGFYYRLAASPGAALAIMRMNREIDVRHILPTVRVPTLILHRVGDSLTRVEQARYMARHIPDARLVELPGTDHVPWVGNQDAILDEAQEFLTGVRHAPEVDRVLATVLFTDIVGSTERAAQVGDRRWRDLLDRYYVAARRELTRFRGRELDTAGDGVLASFDGPARGVRCAEALIDAVRPLGIDVRAGLHTGECEVMGDKLGGLAVHIGARVASLAGPGEVLVSHTLKDLVAGSGLRFTDRGTHALKGVPGDWRLFAVER
jgi:pimeloyl-ACP methyl ester carboxylesterase